MSKCNRKDLQSMQCCACWCVPACRTALLASWLVWFVCTDLSSALTSSLLSLRRGGFGGFSDYFLKNYLASYSCEAPQANLRICYLDPNLQLLSCSTSSVGRAMSLSFQLQNIVRQAQLAGSSGAEHQIGLAQGFCKIPRVMWQPGEPLWRGTIASLALWLVLILWIISYQDIAPCAGL